MKIATPLKVIRATCRDCCCESAKAVRWCPATDCPLWPCRFGLRPATARRRYGDRLMDPDQMPDHTISLEVLR